MKITQQKDFCFMAFTLCCNAVYIFLMYKCVSLCAPCFTVVNLERFDLIQIKDLRFLFVHSEHTRSVSTLFCT